MPESDKVAWRSLGSRLLIGGLIGAGAQLEEVRRGTASLEEVFLTLVGGEDGKNAS